MTSPQSPVPNCQSQIAISVKNISKKYQLYDNPKQRLKEALHPFRKKYHHDFWALRNISLDIKRGETIGIIGRNGSGKSTLLQIICGTLTPSQGEIKVNGRVSALLELGAGFNPEFTGKENVYMNGAIIGLTREEMDMRFDDIADFADIGDFIDQPVKTYSSGMYVRLAFAVAINVDPEILIIDEALAVGDSMFQRRCYKKIDEFKERQKTIIFVSHGLQTVIQLCDLAILMDEGKILQIDESKKVVFTYSEMMVAKDEEYKKWIEKTKNQKQETQDIRLEEPVSADDKTDFSEYRYGTGEAEIKDIQILNKRGETVSILESGECCTFTITVIFHRTVEDPSVGFLISTLSGIHIYGTNTKILKYTFGTKRAGDMVTAKFDQEIWLNAGSYSFTGGVVEHSDKAIEVLDRREDIKIFKVICKDDFAGVANLNSKVTVG